MRRESFHEGDRRKGRHHERGERPAMKGRGRRGLAGGRRGEASPLPQSLVMTGAAGGRGGAGAGESGSVSRRDGKTGDL